jgi:DNA repair exonuclease SbcCD nuclease subunit
VRAMLIGDIHARDTSPRNRLPGYLDEVIDLLTQAADMQTAMGIECVVLAGDIFDHKRPGATSHGTIVRLINTLRLFANAYVVTGNHDIRNDRLDTLDTQPLGVLIASGALKPLDGWMRNTEDYPIYGLPWLQDWKDPKAREAALEDWHKISPRYRANSLIVTHAPIYPPDKAQSQMFELVPTHGPNSLSEAMGNHGYVYYGHIHEDHGIFTDDGVTYCNVGALSRGSLNEHNTSRAIQVAVWDSTSGFSTHELDYQPADSIFAVQRVLDNKASAASLDEFLSEVGSATLDISNTHSVIDHIRTRTDLGPRVPPLAIKILEEMDSNG